MNILVTINPIAEIRALNGDVIKNTISSNSVFVGPDNGSIIGFKAEDIAFPKTKSQTSKTVMVIIKITSVLLSICAHPYSLYS